MTSWDIGGDGVVVAEGSVCQRDGGSWIMAINQPLPCLMSLPDNIIGILLVLALPRESKLVLRLSIWDLIDTEPLIGGPEEAWEVTLNIFNVVEFRGQWVLLIDHNDLPVGFLLIKKGHNTKDFDALDLARGSDELTNFTYIKWVVVTLSLSLRMDVLWVFPSLRESTIVPQISLVGETIADVAKLALLDILLNGVQRFFLADLHLCVGPPWDLNNHVEESLLLIGIERNIVEWRNYVAISLDVDTMVKGVRLGNFSHRVRH